MSDASTVDHKSRHVWVRTTGGIRCAYRTSHRKQQPRSARKQPRLAAFLTVGRARRGGGCRLAGGQRVHALVARHHTKSP